MKCISENQRTILDVLLMNGVFFNAVNLPAPLHFLFYSFWRIFFSKGDPTLVSAVQMQRLCSTHQCTNDRGSQSALEPKTKSKFLSPWFCSWIFSADQCLSFTFHDYFPWCQFFFNYTNTIFVLYFEFVWWGGLTLPANLLKGPAFHFSDHYTEKLLLIWLESLSDLEYASLWEFKQMKTIYFNSEFSAEVFFFSYYTKFFQNAYVSEMFV